MSSYLPQRRTERAATAGQLPVVALGEVAVLHLRHPDPAHDALARLVCNHREGLHAARAEDGKGIGECGGSRLGRVALAPELSAQPPADLHGRADGNSAPDQVATYRAYQRCIGRALNGPEDWLSGDRPLAQPVDNLRPLGAISCRLEAASRPDRNGWRQGRPYRRPASPAGSIGR